MSEDHNKDFVLGLDVGTSSAKVCALALDGRFLGAESETYPTLIPNPAWAEQDADVWLPALAQACGRLLARLGLHGDRARGLAITSAAHIGVLLDDNGRPLRPSLLWHDQRSQAEAKELASLAGDEIFAIGRNWPTTTWTLPHFLWIARHEPQVWSNVKHVLLSKDYVAYQLTGRMTSDPAAAVSALLYDAEAGGWSKRLCELAGLAPSTLPEILPIGARIGKLTRGAAECLGLSENTLVFNGTMDSTAETFSAGVRKEGECVIRLASAGGIHGISHPPRVHPKLISYPYPVAPYWLSQAGTNSCASAVSWACNLLSEEANGEPDYGAWTELAEQAPAGCNGLLFHPYLAGERCPYWDGDLRASFIGMGHHHGRSDIARAVYEGTAYSLRDALGVLEQQGFALSQVKLLGGGAKSALWCQSISNILECPAQTVPEADSSTGAALFALTGLGVFSTLDEVPADIVSNNAGPVLTPDASLMELHRAAFARYLRAQKHLSAIYHDC